jgi:hypothetical protein
VPFSASQDALAFERAADAFGHALHERLQLFLTRGLNSPEHGRLGINEIGAVEHESVKVNIEIEGRPKSLDQRHRTRRAARARQSRLLENVGRDRSVGHLRLFEVRAGLG